MREHILTLMMQIYAQESSPSHWQIGFISCHDPKVDTFFYTIAEAVIMICNLYGMSCDDNGNILASKLMGDLKLHLT